jgi:putative methionine-R-sulfoxide reductase with GAF domain
MNTSFDNPTQPTIQNTKVVEILSTVVEPSKVIVEKKTRQHARLVSILLLVLCVLLTAGLAVTVLQYTPEKVEHVYIFTIIGFVIYISYVISRTRYYYIAGILALLSLSTIPFTETIIYQDGTGIADALMWLVIPLILSTVLLRVRDQLLLALIDLAGLIVLVRIFPQSIRQLQAIGAYIVVACGILIILDVYRRRQPEIQQSELLKSYQELEAKRVSLEHQVEDNKRSTEETRRIAEEANSALEKQMWQVTGLAELAAIMRGVQSTANLTTGIIRQVCQYADIPVGAIFIAEGDELRLAGSYAYPFVAKPVPRYKFGSGLVGEAAQSQQIVSLRDIPEHFLPITSGLGEITPGQIIAVPCTFENQVIAVIELASMQPFTSAQTQFLTSAMEPIASALETAQIRAQISTLLVDTQQQSKELQWQDLDEERQVIDGNNMGDMTVPHDTGDDAHET